MNRCSGAKLVAHRVHSEDMVLKKTRRPLTTEEEGKDGDKPELTRGERQDLKKKQTAEKQKAKALDNEEGDDDLINPNHIRKKLNISDLGAPRKLSRRGRCVTLPRLLCGDAHKFLGKPKRRRKRIGRCEPLGLHILWLSSSSQMHVRSSQS